MPFYTNYNPTDPQDILRYAKWLIGKTFYNVIETDISIKAERISKQGYEQKESEGIKLQDISNEYGNHKRKGGLGNLIEEHYFHYDANSNPDSDFPGLELKVTPYEQRIGRGKQKGQIYYVAGERLVLTMIDYNHRPIEYSLEESHLWKKCKNILLVYYLRDKLLGDNLKFRINYVDIFTPNETDRIIITKDYLFIMKKIAEGKAHQISESDTMYLGACTKGSTAAKSVVIQSENGIPAQKRAFCYKTSYMTAVLNKYFIKAQEEYESIIIDKNSLQELGFEGYVKNKIKGYIGMSDRDICSILNIEYSGNKSQWIRIAFAMLGIKSNKAEELQKANIVVKAIRIEDNGTIKENTSFPAFKFKELAEEQWIESDDQEVEHPSTLQKYFATTKFLFVVFKKVEGQYILRGCQLWNMPFTDLNTIVRDGWEKIKSTIVNGIVFTKRTVKSGERIGSLDILNNLPSKDDNPIIHIRPHASRAYYKIDGYENGKPADGDELPDGRWMTKQCFWLNNTYVKSILRTDLL